jgi:hypothetical protein
MTIQLSIQQVELLCLVARHDHLTISPLGRIELRASPVYYTSQTWRALLRHGLITYDRAAQIVSINDAGGQMVARITMALRGPFACPHDARVTMGAAHA